MINAPTDATTKATRRAFDTVGISDSASFEDGFDALFVQQQVGHEHASTTSIYTSVSSDYRTKMVRDAIDRAVAQAKEAGTQW